GPGRLLPFRGQPGGAAPGGGGGRALPPHARRRAVRGPRHVDPGNAPGHSRRPGLWPLLQARVQARGRAGGGKAARRCFGRRRKKAGRRCLGRRRGQAGRRCSGMRRRRGAGSAGAERRRCARLFAPLCPPLLASLARPPGRSPTPPGLAALLRGAQAARPGRFHGGVAEEHAHQAEAHGHRTARHGAALDAPAPGKPHLLLLPLPAPP
ncbi:hypothetical protein H632_c5116p0, partial [Helicosporidium sp. ATCC 50920]